jgi:hypothetical protein
MKCVACNKSETRPGKTTVVLQRDGATVAINPGKPASYRALRSNKRSPIRLGLRAPWRVGRDPPLTPM